MLLSALTKIVFRNATFSTYQNGRQRRTILICMSLFMYQYKNYIPVRNNFIHSQSKFEDQLHTTLLHTYICVCQQVYIFQCCFVQLTGICLQTSNTVCQPAKYLDDIQSVQFLHKFNWVFHSKVFKYFTVDLLLVDCWYARHMKIFFTNF